MKFAEFINRYLERSSLHFVSIAVLITTAVALVIISLTPPNQKTIFGTHVGADYASLYIAGKILNDYQPTKLYDLKVQSDLCHKLLPHLSTHQTLPYPYPPFLALIFRPLANLPYTFSWLLWFSFSFSLYTLGLVLILKSLKVIPKSYFPTCILLSLSFEPFIIECCLGGQTSALGFFAMALSFYLYDRRYLKLSGFALGLCIYKPTLLIFIFPLLLVARQTKILAGFFLCGAGLFLISIVAFGWDTCTSWFEIVLGFVRSVGAREILKTSKLIDITANYRMIFGEIGRTGQILLVCIYSSWLIAYFFLLRRFNANNRLIIASALCWTATFNAYFPIYDSIIVLLSILLTVDVYCGTYERFDPKLKILLCLIYLTPWISQALANLVKFQIYTLVIVGLGIYQLIMLRQLSKDFIQSNHRMV